MTPVEYICGTIIWIAIICCFDDLINTYMKYKHEEKMGKEKLLDENKQVWKRSNIEGL